MVEILLYLGLGLQPLHLLVVVVAVHIAVVRQHLAVRAVVDVTMLAVLLVHQDKEMMVVMAATLMVQVAAVQELKVQHLEVAVLVE
jgi:hypothetical protein